uniref:Putative secreted protein n=1 Tax=Anopheles marajoara TaxID=58244 RepID=A0A2M4C8H2_9DIPT
MKALSSILSSFSSSSESAPPAVSCSPSNPYSASASSAASWAFFLTAPITEYEYGAITLLYARVRAAFTFPSTVSMGLLCLGQVLSSTRESMSSRSSRYSLMTSSESFTPSAPRFCSG